MYSVTTCFSWSKHCDMVIFNFEDSAVFPLFMICTLAQLHSAAAQRN